MSSGCNGALSASEIDQLARSLLDQHGLKKWRFRLDHARQRCGSCNYATREITVSKHFTALNSAEEVRNTLLHEIAHALVGPGHRHGPTWQATAQRLGARVEATSRTAHMPQPKWRLCCTRCRRTVAQRHQRRLDLNLHRCAWCGVDAGILEWRRNAPVS